MYSETMEQLQHNIAKSLKPKLHIRCRPQNLKARTKDYDVIFPVYWVRIMCLWIAICLVNCDTTVCVRN
jgi:hypothetical protein